MTDGSRRKSRTGVSTGYRVLDKFIGGFKGSQLVVIASRPSEGKSALAASLAENMAFGESQVPIGFIPLEAGGLSQMKCIISSKAIIRNSPVISLHALCRGIREMVENDGVRVVFIDGVGLIRKTESGMPGSQWYAEVFKQLKLLAKELEITIVCSCHLNRTGPADRSPVIGDIEYSDMIKGFPDIILLIDNPAMRLGIKEDDTGMSDIRKVIVAKNSNGNTGGFLMRLNSEIGRFEEVMREEK